MKSSHPIDTPAAGTKDGTLYVAFELSKSKWLIPIVLSGESQLSRHAVSVVFGGGVAAALVCARRRRRSCGGRCAW